MDRLRAQGASGSAEPVLRLVALGLHVLVGVLLAIGCVRLVSGPARHGWTITLGLTAAVCFALAYAAGLVRAMGPDPGPAPRRWLALVVLCWVALLAFGAEFGWLAFPLFFAHLHLLQPRLAWFAITLMTLLVVLSGWWHGGRLSVGAVLGPVLGAVVAVLVALGYRALHRESVARLAALEELGRTRDALAASQREAGRLAERERLSRDLHDTVAQGLASLVLLARDAGNLLEHAPQEARCRIQDLEQVAAENLAETRRLVADLAPAELVRESLPEALARLVAREDAASPAVWEMRVEGDPVPLPGPVATGLLRAARASWANVREHARAARVVTTLTFAADSVSLDVHDDGIGFDPAAAPGPDSFGLAGVRSRVEQLGGRCEVESAPGEGTVVALQIPLGRAHA